MSVQSSSHDAGEIVRQSRSNLAFALASLPKQRREDMHVYYAFCRIVDDIADDEGMPVEKRHEGLQRWRDVVHGKAQSLTPLEQAVTGVQEHHAVPVEEMEGVIDGVTMDLEPRRYATWEMLRVYCYRVACCVGLVSTRIFGCRSPKSRDYAVNLGYALQITNILRDIHGDWENGHRVYLPQDEMAAAGYTEDDIAHGRVNDAFLRLMEQQIARARHYYQAAVEAHTEEDRIPLLASETMRRIYSETLDLLEKDGCRVYDQRYRLPKWRKAQLVAGAWFRGMQARYFGGDFP
ncbi:MAG TPA: phytoene/squalene synthase family protein [Verrucomicrobiales bacterium]|nr:phytoene/squalene synthase family protein [Verrucomicrobiales bacterium]